MTPDTGRPLRLGRDRKLRKTDDFSSVFRFKRVMRGACVDIYARPNGLSHARLGMIVPRRVARHAVARNLYKRLMREMFRLRQHELAPLDLVARLKSVCAKDRFREDFSQLLAGCQASDQAPHHAPNPDASTS